MAINADTTYIASYHAPNGDYAASNDYFSSAGVDSLRCTPWAARRARTGSTNTVPPAGCSPAAARTASRHQLLGRRGLRQQRPPTAVNDQKSVDEDSGATAIDVRANDTDPDGGPKTITSATQPAHGTVTVAPDGSDLSYTPNPDYCNSAGPRDDFTYTLNGGSSATVALSVNCVDDPPSAVNDQKSVDEDSGGDGDRRPRQRHRPRRRPEDDHPATQPAHGRVTVAPDGSDLSYTPNPDYCNSAGPSDDFTYTLNGGSSATVALRRQLRR